MQDFAQGVDAARRQGDLIMTIADHPARTDPLWSDQERRVRKPRMGLSLSRIAEAAIAVADTDGIAAVSMQRVAEDLGFTKMSLYRHVADKAELVNVMIDTAVGRLQPRGVALPSARNIAIDDGRRRRA